VHALAVGVLDGLEAEPSGGLVVDHDYVIEQLAPSRMLPIQLSAEPFYRGDRTAVGFGLIPSCSIQSITRSEKIESLCVGCEGALS
jgi:hypothetical protein